MGKSARRIPQGVDLNVTVTRARLLPQLGTCWGLLQFVTQHDPERIRIESGGDYAWHADSLPGVDAVKVYLKNLQTAEKLLAEFGPELARL